MQEGDDGCEVFGGHQDGRLQARAGAAESYVQPRDQHQGIYINKGKNMKEYI